MELVPRTLDALTAELTAVREALPMVDTVNIPDLLRFDVRSWDACVTAKQHVKHAIPHLRAIDINLTKPLVMGKLLEKHNINEVIIVTGDAPADMSRSVYATNPLQVIKKMRAEHPGVKVYAALDPYRQGFVQERDYALQKLEAGASGLFTQPFFDLRLMEIYAELLPDVEIFWGLTTVTSARSLSYWQNRNKAVFPAAFELGLEWDRAFARQAIAFARERDANLYFMPIRTSAVTYLQGLLE